MYADISPWRKHLHAADDFSRRLFQIQAKGNALFISNQAPNAGEQLGQTFPAITPTLQRKQAGKTMAVLPVLRCTAMFASTYKIPDISHALWGQYKSKNTVHCPAISRPAQGLWGGGGRKYK